MNNEKFIFLVEKYDFLYNKKSPAYKNVQKKRDTWEIISKELNTSVDACIKGWTAIRDRYVREIHRYVPSGSGGQEQNKWHLYDMMNFLESHVKPRQTRNSTNIVATKTSTNIPLEVEISKFVEPQSTLSFKDRTSPSPHSFSEYFPPMSPSQLSSEALLPTQSEPSNFFDRNKRKVSKVSAADEALFEAVNSLKKFAKIKYAETTLQCRASAR